jgi:hypothetical protein
VSRRLVALTALGCLVLAVLAAGAGAQDTDVTIASVEPASGPAGTEIRYTLDGTDEAGAQECAVSSAYRLELLATDGTLAATGGEAVAVPEGAAAGPASIRLVCYVPDATGRRVIYGLCGRFDVTAGDESTEPEGTAAVPCPATPRAAFGQAVIAVERAMSEAFNPQLYYPLPK